MLFRSAIGYFDAGVMLESTVTYQLEVFEVDEIGHETAMLNVSIGAVNDYVVDIPQDTWIEQPWDMGVVFVPPISGR